MFYVLLATRARLRAARRLRVAPRAQSRATARPRRARHRRRRRAPRPDQPRLRRAGARAHACRARAPRRARAVRGGGPRRAPRDRVRPGLRRGTAPQCGRPPRRHVDRHPLPARRLRGRSDGPRARARPAQPRAARGRGDDAGRSARRSRAGCDRRRRRPATRCACSGPSGTRAWSASSRRGSRTASTARRSCSRAQRTASCAAPAARSPGFTCATRSISSPSAHPGTIAKFGGHAFAAGLTLARAALPAFREAFEDVGARTAHAGRARADAAKATARLAPGELTFELAGLLRDRVWGQGMPPPTFDDTFDGGRHADRGRAAHQADPRARRRAVRGDPVRPRRAPAAAAARGLSARRSTSGRARWASS